LSSLARRHLGLCVGDGEPRGDWGGREQRLQEYGRCGRAPNACANWEHLDVLAADAAYAADLLIGATEYIGE